MMYQHPTQQGGEVPTMWPGMPSSFYPSRAAANQNGVVVPNELIQPASFATNGGLHAPPFIQEASFANFVLSRPQSESAPCCSRFPPSQMDPNQLFRMRPKLDQLQVLARAGMWSTTPMSFDTNGDPQSLSGLSLTSRMPGFSQSVINTSITVPQNRAIDSIMPRCFPTTSEDQHRQFQAMHQHPVRVNMFQPFPFAPGVPGEQRPIQAKPTSRKRTSLSTLTAASISSSDEDEDSLVVITSHSSTKRGRLDVPPRLPTISEDGPSEMGLGGESRLKISFANVGSPGRYPQVFGKSRLGVPDGLSGTYVLYSERWRSEIVHERNSEFESAEGTKHVLVTWKITNLSSGVTQSRTETSREALLRYKDGRTLCNKVFRKALEHRAMELENELKSETSPIRAKTLKNLIKKLRPKHFSEGPLVFGLRHECVQNRFKALTCINDRGLLALKQ